MQVNKYKNQNAVFGLGKTGLSVINALIKSKAEVYAWDDNAEQIENAKMVYQECNFIHPREYDWKKINALILSPGIPISYPEQHWIVKLARAFNCKIKSDIELFLEVRTEKQKIVGITGTNGKSTTTSLIGHILSTVGKNVAIGGNLGTPVLDLDANAEIYVIELSSFQLEQVDKINRPLAEPVYNEKFLGESQMSTAEYSNVFEEHNQVSTTKLPLETELCKRSNVDISVLLNITADHIDRHGSMENYIAAKLKLINGSKTAVIGCDNEVTARVFNDFTGNKVPISGKAFIEEYLRSTEVKKMGSMDPSVKHTTVRTCTYVYKTVLSQCLTHNCTNVAFLGQLHTQWCHPSAQTLGSSRLLPANNFCIFYENANQKENSDYWIPVSRTGMTPYRVNIRTVVCLIMGSSRLLPASFPIFRESINQKENKCIMDPSVKHWDDKRLEGMPLSNAKINLISNAENIAAAYAVCKILGINSSNIISGIESFSGLKHRNEPLGKIKNMLFVNDSKATNAESSEKAILSYENIYWIVGGKSKEGGIESLSRHFTRIKKAYLIGESSKVFADTLEDKVNFVQCGNLKNAFEFAYKDALSAKEEVTILLSPACSSFDQWKNFEERGEAFCNMFEKLKDSFTIKHTT